jgi:hypothetical protein
MKIKVPLARLLEFIKDAERIDEEYPHLHQRAWLLQNFSFNDCTATYSPAPMPWPMRHGGGLQARWWWHNRNSLGC